MADDARGADSVGVDLVGSRDRLVLVGLSAVFGSCVLFAALRLVTQLTTGQPTPWWGNAIGAVVIPLLYLFYRGDRAKRSSVAFHGGALVATVALTVPAFYGMTSSKWWIALVGFAVMLIGRRTEAYTWVGVSLLLVPTLALVEPWIAVPGAIGETPIERAMAGLIFMALLYGVTLAFRRVAERRARELKDMADSLERAARVRSRFLAHMSHEIRTPLHGAIAMTDLALAGDLNEEAQSHVRSAYDSAQVLLTLLNNILDVTRVDAGAIELAAQPFDLHATMRETLHAFTGRALAKKLRFEATAAPGLLAHRVGDRARLMQIVLNLVGNAVKFTEQGHVAVRLAPDGEDPDRVCLFVEDSGRGIELAQREHIFAPFVQSNPEDSRLEEGAGLGLPIAKALAELMDGDITVDGEPGEGARFTVRLRLPVDPNAEPTAGPEDLLAAEARCEPALPASLPSEGRCILVCEDDATGRRALKRMLARMGHTPVVVASGEEAWGRLQEEQFDLLVTDIEMPGMDGVELMRRVREREDGEAALPIIAATAHVGLHQTELLVNAGATTHLPKPFTMQRLRDALACALTPRE